ncbi:hypothetical protein [Peribacillus frigoritolerans]|uniref:hypothetical protein n=1 Tax=Peribacillus frigoritolerans TaxID=450367 RepID=UPI001070E889|nr:hypothetical protein [Peribacillus frigoritolerans]TFH58369.1 hypothetical protein E4J71_24935 [Peribacillus frigoritolerans]
MRVKENDVVNQINISTEGILIDGKKVHITGQTMIDNAVIATANIKDANIPTAKIANLAVGTAAIANAAITNAKIGNLSVGTAQLQDAASTNAKIANASIDSAKISSLSADKLNAGAIRGIDIFGSKFRSSDGSTNLEIVGGNVRLTQNGGSYVNMNPNGVYGYNSGGSERFRMDKGLVTSASLGTSNSNVYLAPDSTNEVRVVDLASIPSDGIAENYSYRHINNGTHVYIRPTSGGEAKVTSTGTTGNFRPIRARTFTTDTSMRENKKDIEVFSEDSLDVFRNAQIYTYRRLNDDQFAFKQLGMMSDETPRILHGEAGDSFDLYALTAYMGKGIKDIITITDKHGDEINWLKIENQYLKQKIKQLEDRMGAP